MVFERHGAPATLAAVSETVSAQQDETAALRARVAELERELAERTERANAAVAAAEDRLYWLDRWHVDLDRVMEHRLAQRVFTTVTQLRRVKRFAGRIRRRVRQ
jgi:hypothetical protein